VTTATTHESCMLIGGELTAARDGKQFDNLNPFAETVVGAVADADSADMDAAIGAARSRRHRPGGPTTSSSASIACRSCRPGWKPTVRHYAPS